MELEAHHHHQQELRHVCKFCSKRFGCGRSLGGHMRSHMINDASAIAADGTKLTRKKLPPLSTYFISNPTSDKSKSVKNICGPGIPGYVLRENPRRSWKLSDPPLLPPLSDDHNDLERSCMDSQSDNETSAPGKKKRSKRPTRYTGPANSSSVSFANNASEIDQEQEEVAMCLILLSRDVGQWVGSNYPVNSSDNNYVSLEEGEEPEEENQVENKKLAIHEAGEMVLDSCNHLIKRKSIDSFKLGEIAPETLKKFKALDGEGGSTEFQCSTCNKVFYSYQALGGHRASHKKTKGCFASKVDSSDSSIEAESSPNQTEAQADQVLATDCEDRSGTSNRTQKSRMHECPICLRVFPSGQALGGHKRAHLVGAPIDLHHQPVAAVPEQIILDLNLPHPVEEEINGFVGFSPWWLGSNHKLEPILGLI